MPSVTTQEENIVERLFGRRRKGLQAAEIKMEKLKEGSEQGDTDSQVELAKCYIYGGSMHPYEYFPMNRYKAVPLLRKAVAQDHPDGYWYLGYCYSQGFGVAKSSEYAMKYYLKAVEKNHPEAQWKLEYFTIPGINVIDIDFKFFIEFLIASSEKGFDEAQYRLGTAYFNGSGVEQDYSMAYKWYHKAADQGHSASINMVANFYFKGLGSIDKDEEEAVRLLIKASEQDNETAQLNLGTCYFNGRGIAKDLKEAKRWLHKAVKNGCENAEKFCKAHNL